MSAAPQATQDTSQTSTSTVNDANPQSSVTLTELPGYFEDVAIDDLVILIADLLQRMIVHNDQIPLSPEGLTRFHSRSTPGISVLDYLRRIVRYVRVERSVLLIMLHSIDQICTRRPSFNISSLSVHRFIIASITILSKAFCDAFSPNPLFAKVGGVSLIELNLLEREFLSAMDWRLACTREVLHTYYVKLVRTHSSGRYTVPDTSPRPAPIDTLPSDQIEWDVSLFSSTEPSSSGRRSKNAHTRPGSAVSPDMTASMDHDAEDSSDDGASSSEIDSSPTMATDITRPSRRIPSGGVSATTLPAVNSTPGHGSMKRGATQPSSAATLEQNVAFMEMSGRRGPSTLRTSGIGSNNSPANGMSPATDALHAKSPAHPFRSPIVGRRRRRSSADAEDVLVANALLRASGEIIDTGPTASVEGLIRSSRRRRLGHPETNERDLRMEVEPGTPSQALGSS